MFSAVEKQQIDWPAQIESLRRTIEDGRSPSIIGPDDAVVGDVECEGILTVFGKVCGDVHSHTVVVEEGGEIEGRVVAQRALIGGCVRGQVVATEIGIEGTAFVHGSIIHHNLAIEPAPRSRAAGHGGREPNSAEQTSKAEGEWQMFSKSGGNKPQSRPQSGPAPEPKATSGAVEPSRIGNDMAITGDITGAGDLVIDGKIDGDIQCHSLTVGKAGQIDGNIAADKARLGGRISGRIEATTIAIEATAKIEGELIHEVLSIEAGAAIEAHLRRPGSGTDKSASRDTSNVAKIAAAGGGTYGGASNKAASD